jgi:diguanylate cyclase (GGDEF)-like protein
MTRYSPEQFEVGKPTSMPLKSIYELLPHEIDKLSLKRFQWLSFPPPLEARFEQDTSAYRSARLWIEGMCAIAFFNLFLFANHFLLDSVSWRSVLMRTALVTPLALLVSFTMRLNPPKAVRESSIAIVSCWICFVHLYLERSSNAMGPAYAQVGVVVAVLFVNIVMRLRFPYALVASLAMIAADVMFLTQDGAQEPAAKIFGASLTMCAISMTLMANYSLNREERLEYLLRLRREMQSAMLSSSNEELQRLSNQDALTGLANRYAFSSTYLKLWKQALTSRTPLSVILIDIDNFKAVNDLCGHLYGDRVLQRVALLVQQALRVKGDFAARYGGEEFVVLLPGTSPEVAMMVAERIRKLVEVAGAPALENDVTELPTAWTTVSCGVATGWPTHTDVQDHLIDAADRALYQAKANGRNCICYGEPAERRIHASGIRKMMEVPLRDRA